MRPPPLLLLGSLAALTSLAACGTSGSFRQATLAGQCAQGDAACARRHPLAPLAIGAQFYPEVSVDVAGTTAPRLHLESSAPSVIAVDDGALVAREAGTSAVLMTTDDGSVVDFVHVWAAPATRVTLTRRDGERVDGALGLTVGEDLTLVPALWSGSQRLAGAGDLTWTASDATAVAILADGAPDRRRLRARAPGRTTVTVALGDLRTTLDVEVVP